jgi:hypothetical protein
MTIIKAERAVIELGNIPLDVYMVPDGSYRLSGRNISDAVDESTNTMLRMMVVKSLKDLPHKDSDCYKDFKVSTGKTGVPFYPITIETACLYCGKVAEKGNKKALALLVATASEAIERRADAVFKIVRDEDVRNARLKARVEGILQRNFWTDTIKWYLETHEVSPDYERFIYSNVSDLVNIAFFGMKAKDVRQKLRLTPKQATKDYIPPEALPEITFVEKYAGMQVKKGIEPLQAIQEALQFANVTKLSI